MEAESRTWRPSSANWSRNNRLDLDALAQIAADYPVSVGQRVGWLLEHVATLLDVTVDFSALTEGVKGAERVVLVPSAGGVGPATGPWNVVVNTAVEPDL